MVNEQNYSKETPRISNGVKLLPKIKLFWDFTRPFTLVAPALGFISGGVTAVGSGHRSGTNFLLFISISLSACGISLPIAIKRQESKINQNAQLSEATLPELPNYQQNNFSSFEKPDQNKEL